MKNMLDIKKLFHTCKSSPARRSINTIMKPQGEVFKLGYKQSGEGTVTEVGQGDLWV